MKKLLSLTANISLMLIFLNALVYSCATKNDAREQADKLYKQGLELAEKGGVPNMIEAAALYKKSFEADSSFANAYAAYANTYASLGGGFNYLSPEKVIPEIKFAADKAVALDPNLAWGWVAKANVELLSTWDWTAFGNYLKKAVDLDPNNATLLIWYTNYLDMMKRSDEAKQFEERAMKITPENQVVINYTRYKMAKAGEFEKVKQSIKKDIEANPKDPYPYWQMAVLCSREGKPEEALANLAIQIPLMNGDIADEVALSGFNLGRMGKTEEAMAELKKLDELAEKGTYVSPALKAWVYAGLNNKDEAMAFLEKGYNERAFRMGLDLNGFSFIFKSLEDDPRYIELMKKMKL
jgi:Tfp pilus assembly protein PilF